MKQRFSTYWMALALIVILTLWLAMGNVQTAKSEAPDAQQQENGGPVPVAFRLSDAETINRELPIQGTLEAWRQVDLKARINGVVEALPVLKGTRVDAKQQLVLLSVEDRAAQLEKARADVTLAKAQLEAAQSLQGQGLGTDTDVAARRAALAQAQAELAERSQQLADTKIAAPFAGVLELLPVEIGQTVTPGMDLARVVDDTRLKLVGQVPQQLVPQLSLGQAVRATLLDGRQLEGSIIYIAHQADPQTRSFRIEASMENPDRLRLAGATASLAVALGSVKAHPISPALLSLNDQGGLSVAYIDTDDQVQRKPVERVKTSADAVWVIGLPEQVRLITMGRNLVEAGHKVKPIAESELKRGAAAHE